MAEDELVRELTAVTGSQRKALGIAGVARSPWHHRQHPRHHQCPH